jgi:hypothetical protein
MGTGVLSPMVKRPGRETDYLPPTSAEVKKTWTYTSTPHYLSAYFHIHLLIYVFTHVFVCLLQEEAPPYYSSTVRDAYSDRFPTRWVGR